MKNYQQNLTTDRKSLKKNVERLAVEALAVMLDEELASVADSFEERRNDAQKSGNYAMQINFEEDISYIRREQQLRSARRRAHAAYVNELQLELQKLDENEHLYPQFDDRCNREFADAWWRWHN